jgi:hypothetical protein
MHTPPLPHACFFHFNDTCSLGSNRSTEFLESMLSFLEGRPTTGSRMLWSILFNPIACLFVYSRKRVFLMMPFFFGSFWYLLQCYTGIWNYTGHVPVWYPYSLLSLELHPKHVLCTLDNCKMLYCQLLLPVTIASYNCQLQLPVTILWGTILFTTAL